MKTLVLVFLNLSILGLVFFLLRKPGLLTYYQDGRFWLTWLSVAVITLMDELTSVFYAPAEAYRLGLTHSSDSKELVESCPAQSVETIHQKEEQAGCLQCVAQGRMTWEQWNAACGGQFRQVQRTYPGQFLNTFFLSGFPEVSRQGHCIQTGVTELSSHDSLTCLIKEGEVKLGQMAYQNRSCAIIKKTGYDSFRLRGFHDLLRCDPVDERAFTRKATLCAQQRMKRVIQTNFHSTYSDGGNRHYFVSTFIQTRQFRVEHHKVV